MSNQSLKIGFVGNPRGAKKAANVFAHFGKLQNGFDGSPP